jgi:hypothetical protein
MASPVHGDYRRDQAKIPRIALCRSPGPALFGLNSEAASAYIKSQAHAGWTLIRSRYDGGGYSVAVPELPVGYRAPPERLKALCDLLLSDLHKPLVVSDAAARIGVQGMGGDPREWRKNSLSGKCGARRRTSHARRSALVLRGWRG